MLFLFYLEHIYERVKLKPQLSCESRVLADVEKASLNRRYGMVLELESQGSSSSSETSSCDTLPCSPMYVDPVDMIRVGSSLGTHLETPVKVNTWGGKRGSGSIIKKHNVSAGNLNCVCVCVGVYTKIDICIHRTSAWPCLLRPARRPRCFA